MRFNYSSCFATNGYCRLVLLFPKIDVNPADGYINEDELTDWNMQQAERDVMHRTQREMETHDKNKDGFVSFAEYEPPTWVRNSGRYPFFSFSFEDYYILWLNLDYDCEIYDGVFTDVCALMHFRYFLICSLLLIWF